MKTPRIVIVIAPQGAGKTTHAEGIAKRFGCTRIVDDWNGRSKLRPGDLALTSITVADAAMMPTAKKAA